MQPRWRSLETAPLRPLKNMGTEKQAAANRKNARRSTGPKTAAGKEKVRYNAVTHGLLVKATLLPDEDEAAFNALSTRIRNDLRPVGEMESILVDRIINIEWRLRRFSHVETGLFIREADASERAALDAVWRGDDQSSTREHSMNKQIKEALLAVEVQHLEKAAAARAATPRHQLGDAFAHDAATGNAFSKLARYETHLVRTLERALKQLQELQHERRRRTQKD